MNEQRMIELLRVHSELAELEEYRKGIDIREKEYDNVRAEIERLKVLLADIMNNVCPVIRSSKQ